MFKFKLLSVFILVSAFGYAQQMATIKGKVLDAGYDMQPMPYANIYIKNTSIGVATNENGWYEMNVTTGNHILNFSFIGYKSIDLPVIVTENGLVLEDVILELDSEKIEDVVIVSESNKQRESALLVDQQKAVGLQTNIGAQELSRKGVSDVATALTKSAGISKQENSGVIYIRGLGDRYNSSTFNGLPIPSNDPEKKNIDLSLFKTDIVEFISVEKVYSAQNFGDFAGASIDINSKDFKSNQELSLDLGTSVNSNAISQNKFFLQDGPKSFGFSNTKIPNNPLNSYGFENSLVLKKVNPISQNFGINFGRNFKFSNDKSLRIFFTASHDNDYQYREGVNQSVSAQGSKLKSFNQQKYEFQTNSTAMLSVGFRPNASNKINFNSLFINSSNQSVDQYKGFIRDIAEDNNGLIRRGTYDKTQLLVNQILGSHTLSDRLNLKWATSYNVVKSDMPDRTQNTLWYNDKLNGNVLATNSATDNHRYFQNLKENEFTTQVVLDVLFKSKDENLMQPKLSFGLENRIKKRDFEATQFNFKIASNQNNTIVDENNLDLFFNQENFSKNYFDIVTFSGDLNPQVYSGTQKIFSGFTNFEYQFSEKWSGSLGLRIEQIVQEVYWKTQLDINGNENILKRTPILPHLILKYKLNDSQNLRFAASKTYTLPQFKERAYFVYEDVTEIKVGNPNLYASDNYNFDVKWEIFPKTNEIFSVGLFSKIILNPINEVTLASSTNDISFINTGKKGTVYGLEFELRKTIFSFASNTKDQISLGLNASLMKTNQDLDSEKVRNETSYNINLTQQKSSFTGASDVLANADISFIKHFQKNASIMTTLSYSYNSDKLYALGSENKGNLVDKSIGSLDFILKSKLSQSIGINFAIKNILNPTFSRVQENSDQHITVLSYKRGVNLGLSIQYLF